MASTNNKTATFPIRMTPKMKAAIIKCANRLGVKPTEWVRNTLITAVMADCPLPNQQHQESANEQV